MAACCFSCGHIPPTITHHETTREIYLPLASRLKQHARFWLAAIAAVGIRVVASLDVITDLFGKQLAVHRIHHFQLLNTGCDIGLVGDDNDQKVGFAQCLGCALDTREKLEVVEGGRRIWLAVTHECSIDDAITVKEHCPPQHTRRSIRGERSHHFVANCCKSGWDTRQCQTTA